MKRSYVLLGVSYVLRKVGDGIKLVKSPLQAGSLKTVDGITYVLNHNSRWERKNESSPSSAAKLEIIEDNKSAHEFKVEPRNMNVGDFLNTYQPINDTDRQKVEEIALSIAENGWQGAPLVVLDGGWLITGSHRYEALSLAVNQDYIDYRFEVPVVDLDELFESEGLDLEEVMEEEGCESPEDFSCFVWVLDNLPPEIKEQYGIQWE